MDIKTLTFRIQSDFSQAQKGVDGFIESFDKLDTLSSDFGKRLKDAVDIAAGAGAKTSRTAFKDSLPGQTALKSLDDMKSGASGLYQELLRLQGTLEETFTKPTAAINQDIEFIKRLQNEVVGLYAEAGKGKTDLLQNLMGKDPAKAEDSAKKLADIIGQSMVAVQDGLKTIGSQPEILAGLGLDKLPQQAKEGADAISQVVQEMSRLKDMQAKIAENGLTRALNPEGIKAFGAAIQSLDPQIAKAQDQLAKFLDLSSKLGAGSSPQQIQAANQAYQELSNTLGKVSEAQKRAAETGQAAGSLSTLKSVMGDLTLQSGLLAAGFFGWLTVIQTVSGELRSMVSEGIAFQQMMVQLGNATGLTDDQLQKIGSSLRDLSTSTGIPLEGLVQGFKTVSQEGFNVADSEKIVGESTKDTLAFMSDQATAAANLGRAIKDWGGTAQQAAAYNELLATGAIKGSTTFETFSQQFNKGSTVAKQFGLSQTELAADLATVVQRTGDATGAGNQLGLLFTRMQEQSDKLQVAIQAVDPSKTGFFSPQAMNSAGGMQRALEALLEVGARFPQVWKTGLGIFSSTDELINLTSGDASTLTKNLDAMNLAMSGVKTPALDGADKQLDTTAQRIKIVQQEWLDLKRDFGTTVALPAAEGILKYFTDIQTNLSNTGVLLGDYKKLKEAAFDDKDPKAFSAALKQAQEDAAKAQKGLKITPLTAADFPQSPETFHPLPTSVGKDAAGNVIAPWVDSLKKAGEQADMSQQAATDVTTKLATSISTITKGVDDAMKLLAEAQHFNVPENIDKLITPIATTMKKVYDAVANAFQNTPSFTAKSNDDIVKFVTDSLKAMEDIIKLLNDLPTANLSDQSAKIDTLAHDLVTVQKSIQKAFDEANEAAHAGETALSGEIAKSVQAEVSALKDTAELFKQMEGISIPTSNDTLNKLATKTAAIGQMMGPILSDLGPIPDQLGKAAELVGHEATALKDVAALYKEMDGVNFGQPDSTFALLAQKAGLIARLTGPILSAMGEVPDQMNKAAELVGHEATALKDVAGLFKETENVDLGQPDSIIANLAEKARVVARLMGPVLEELGKVPDSMNKAAELVGHEATALKDVAGLFKETEDVDLGQPESIIRTLVEKARLIASEMGPVLSELGKVPPEMDKAAELISHEATALKDIAGMLKDASAITFQDPASLVKQLVEVAEHIAEDMNDVLEELGHTSPNMDKAAQLVSHEAEALKNTAEAINAMEALPTIDEGRIKAGVDQLIDVMKHALAYFDQQLVQTANSPELVGKIATDAANVMKGVGDAAKVVDDMATLPKINEGQMKANLDQLINIMVKSLEYFDQQIKEAPRPIVSEAAKAAGDVMKAVDDVMKVFEISQPKHTAPVTFGDIKKAINMSVDALREFIKAIDQSGIDMGDVARAEKFAEVIDKMFQAIDHIEKAGKDSQVGLGGQNQAQLWLSEGGPQELQRLNQALSQVQGATKNGGPSAGVIAGMQALAAGASTAPHPPQHPPAATLISGLLGETPDSETFGGGYGGLTKKSGPNELPRLPGYHNPASPRVPNPSAGSGPKAEESNTINLEINMDSTKIAEVLGQKYFKGQQMRGQLVPV